MQTRRLFRGVVAIALLASVGTLAYFTRDRWPWFGQSNASAAAAAEPVPVPLSEAKELKLSPQARKNLGLVAQSIKLQTYWRTLQVPGTIGDRPGVSDRGITAPAVGVVTQVHAFPGDTVKAGDRLFTLQVFSEYLQHSQTELFKATRERQMATEHLTRIEAAANRGAIAESKLIELNHELNRQIVAIQAYRQDLLTRGLVPSQIDAVAEGRFVSTIEVVAPHSAPMARAAVPQQPAIPLVEEGVDATEGNSAYELQELKVDLGQQVQAGQLLCLLSNHQSLYIEGHAFRREAPFLERAASNGWAVQVEIAEDDAHNWPPLTQTFQIRHLANLIDPTNRTIDFFIPLANQSRGFEKDGQTFVVWRFRPGQRVRLQVPVEELRNVIVLPAAAVVREGPEAYVFRQNGDLFDRRPVHVLHEDRLHVVVESDGSVKAGMYLAQNGASSLNRVLKAQAAAGIRADVHVHADGTVHGSH